MMCIAYVLVAKIGRSTLCKVVLSTKVFSPYVAVYLQALISSILHVIIFTRAKTLHHRDREWLIRRPSSLLPDNCSSRSSMAGRTDSCASRRRGHTRWDDGVEFGRSQLA